jgi:threonine synthase
MRYASTRGQSPAVSFFDAVLAGLAPDGGLYVPERWPTLRPYLRENRGAMGYAGTAAEILFQFAEGDLSFAGAAELADQAYGSGSRFAHAAVTPLVQLDQRTWLLELFHGPSLAFKDVAMQLIGRLYERALAERDQRLSVVCATSGDTGGAAVEALKGAERSDLFVLMPKGRVSEVQRRFMTASGAENVHALEIDGDFDACQAIVKALFADRAFADRASLSGVNSISWARIAAQAAYYATAAFALGGDGPVDFVVPTGNLGDGLAGLTAKRMGAPIGRIVLATNGNDILARAFESGRYERDAQSRATLSPAMDIQVASNFERLLFEGGGGDAETVRGLYGGFTQSGGFAVPPAWLSAIKAEMSAASADDEETVAAMRLVHGATGEVLCPHTAVAAAVAARGAEGWTRANPTVILATAHPAKFPETVRSALALDPPLPAHCATLFDRPERVTSTPADVAAVKAVIAERSRAYS